MTTKQFLEAEVTLMKSANFGKQYHGYACLSDFILQHGREFDVGNAKVQKNGRMKECFRNAQHLAMFPRNRYIYCEGYANNIIPVIHGWVIRADDLSLVETTWEELGTEYWGIAFNPEYVRRRMLATESYHSLIDDWEYGWPLLQADEDLWKHKEMGQK